MWFDHNDSGEATKRRQLEAAQDDHSARRPQQIANLSPDSSEGPNCGTGKALHPARLFCDMLMRVADVQPEARRHRIEFRSAPIADIGPTSLGALCRFAGTRSAAPCGAALIVPGHDRLAWAETFATRADRKAQAVLRQSDDGGALLSPRPTPTIPALLLPPA